MEATGNALSVARVVEPHVGQVVLAGLTVAALRSPGAARWLGDTAARGGAWFAGLFHRKPPGWSGEALV